MNDMGKARKEIKHAWIAGVISGIATLLLVLTSIVPPIVLMDAFLVAGLTFGIYKKNRGCAIIMLAYFVLSKIIMLTETKNPPIFGIIIAIIFIFYFSEGVLGTFAYHRIINERYAEKEKGELV